MASTIMVSTIMVGNMLVVRESWMLSTFLY